MRLVARAKEQFHEARGVIPRDHPHLPPVEAALTRVEQMAARLRARIRAGAPLMRHGHGSSGRGGDRGGADDGLRDEELDRAKRALHVLLPHAPTRKRKHGAQQSAAEPEKPDASAGDGQHAKGLGAAVNQVEVNASQQGAAANADESGARALHASKQPGEQSKCVTTDDVAQCVLKAAQGLPQKLSVTVSTDAPHVEPLAPVVVMATCKRVWIAALWMQRENVTNGCETPLDERRLVPKLCRIVAVNETPSLYKSSDHAVFAALSERASAMARLVWARHQSPARSFHEFLMWLSLHANVFEDKSVEDSRRLAFDMSRGLYLPPYVHSYLDGDVAQPAGTTPGSQNRTGAVHPRTSIPERSESSAGLSQGNGAVPVQGSGPMVSRTAQGVQGTAASSSHGTAGRSATVGNPPDPKSASMQPRKRQRTAGAASASETVTESGHAVAKTEAVLARNSAMNVAGRSEHNAGPGAQQRPLSRQGPPHLHARLGAEPNVAITQPGAPAQTARVDNAARPALDLGTLHPPFPMTSGSADHTNSLNASRPLPVTSPTASSGRSRGGSISKRPPRGRGATRRS